MKNKYLIGMVLAMLFLFASSVFAETRSDLTKDYTEFTLDGDISWLEGTWKLTNEKSEKNGNIKNVEKIYDTWLKIRGSEKTSSLIQQSKSIKTNSGFRNTHTVEWYFLNNSRRKSSINMVNDKKTKMLLICEIEQYPDEIFYYTFTKQKTKKYEDVATYVREEVIGGTRETISLDHKELLQNLKEMETSLKESQPITGSKNLEKFYEKANNIAETYKNNKKLEYAQYNKIYANYKECLKYWNKEQKLLKK